MFTGSSRFLWDTWYPLLKYQRIFKNKHHLLTSTFFLWICPFLLYTILYSFSFLISLKYIYITTFFPSFLPAKLPLDFFYFLFKYESMSRVYESEGTNILDEAEIIAAIKVEKSVVDFTCREQKKSIYVILRMIFLHQK